MTAAPDGVDADAFLSHGRLTRAACLLIAILGLAGCEPQAESEVAPPEGPERSGLAETLSRPAEGGDVHLVRLVQRGDSYSFDPDSLVIPVGDVLRFVTTGSQPESVAFDVEGPDSAVTRFVREKGMERGVLITRAGEAFDVGFSDAPAGDYSFRSVPHGDQGMRGSVRVTVATGD